MGKLKEPVCATDKGKELIKQKRAKFRYSTDKQSLAIPEASFHKITLVLEERGFRLDIAAKGISYEKIRDLVEDKNQEIFSSQSKEHILSLIADDPPAIRLSSETLRDWVKNKQVIAYGICYKTWNKFYLGQPIEKINFIAYCRALELDWKIVSSSSKEALLELALSQLNHQKQREALQEFCSQTKTLALYLKDDQINTLSCHLLIKNFLAAVNSENVKADLVKFDFSNKRYFFDLTTLWQILHHKFCPTASKKIEEVVYQIAGKLKEQHILLLFEGVHKTDKDYMTKLLEEFWKPLVEGVQEYSEPIQHGLFMYWIDTEPSENKWLKEMSLFQTFSQSWSPKIPIQHESIIPETSFSFQDVDEWIKMEKVQYLLGSDLNKVREILDRIQDNLGFCNSIQPEFLLKEIYNSCQNCSWSDYQLTWKML